MTNPPLVCETESLPILELFLEATSFKRPCALAQWSAVTLHWLWRKPCCCSRPVMWTLVRDDDFEHMLESLVAEKRQGSCCPSWSLWGEKNKIYCKFWGLRDRPAMCSFTGCKCVHTLHIKLDQSKIIQWIHIYTSLLVSQAQWGWAWWSALTQSTLFELFFL